MIVLGACDSGDSPTAPGAPSAGEPDIGILTDLPSPDRLVGAWIRYDEVERDGIDYLRTVEWRFDGRGTCRRTVTLAVAADAFPFVEDAVCAYRADGRTLAVRFGVDTEPQRIRWAVDGRNVLLLGGERFLRARR